VPRSARPALGAPVSPRAGHPFPSHRAGRAGSKFNRSLNSGRAGRVSNRGFRVARVEASPVIFEQCSARRRFRGARDRRERVMPERVTPSGSVWTGPQPRLAAHWLAGARGVWVGSPAAGCALYRSRKGKWMVPVTARHSAVTLVRSFPVVQWGKVASGDNLPSSSVCLVLVQTICLVLVHTRTALIFIAVKWGDPTCAPPLL
jgi:hypothetical protein